MSAIIKRLNKGWKKLMRKAHSDVFECPVCEKLSRIEEKDIKLSGKPIPLPSEEQTPRWFYICPHCGAKSQPHEGLKNFTH